MLLGNCQIGLHEQTRLQPEIKAAMDAPIDEIFHAHLGAALGHGLGASIVSHALAAAQGPIHEIEKLVRELWKRVATRFLMQLALPGGKSLPLGEKIPKSAAAPDFLPPDVRDISSPWELVALLATYDKAHGTGDEGTAATDWCVLPDRMNFIVNLFRSRQQDKTLLGQPFSDAQRSFIERGEVPPATLGRL
jgi:hypothetical protein